MSICTACFLLSPIIFIASLGVAYFLGVLSTMLVIKILDLFFGDYFDD